MARQIEKERQTDSEITPVGNSQKWNNRLSSYKVNSRLSEV